MKATNTLQFVYRFLHIKQKQELRKLAETNNNSLNQEVSAAVEAHLTSNKKKIK